VVTNIFFFNTATFKYEDKSHKISNSIKKNVRKKKLNFFIVIKLCSKYIIKMLVEPYKKLKEIFDDDRKALLYLINNDYVNGYKNCSNCGKDMTLNLNKKLYVCRNYKCRKTISPLNGTIFNKMKLPINIQLHLLHLFLGKVTGTYISSALNIDKNTVVKYKKIFRKYIKNKQLITPDKKIGGKDKIVEMDESKIAKRKYHKGRKIDGAWIIGGIERSNDNKDKKLFMLPIKHRNSINIDYIVNKYINEGTTIYTDCWKGYNNLNNIGYNHKTVNHSKHFVDPITKVHTQSIEATWGAFKRNLMPIHRNKKNIMLHIKEYQWRRNNKNKNIWMEFLKD
jgi:transposase-like protein